ncbi:C-C motif chemokine 13-like [Electrophorus electricus]|uniref:Chemokine interleukin-8-like domain-containing protein n=1 Tax=Electrophorus electricus TaxID=8005 RepID=A0AAY5EMN9_ELEEL|nr:C-C motif chemokine 13-like [Electrophorus electricus]XP_035388062.1 C-C motif chemokine 13-like [Electrophorus electricus]
MRNLSALLFVLLLCSLQLVSSGPDAGNRAICCPNLTQKKLPLKRIVSYNWSRSDCSIKAVVFKMISGKMFCVDPASDWVNNHMKAVDQRTKGPATGKQTSSKH